MNMRHGMLAAFIISVGIISYKDIKQCHQLPFPARLIKTGAVFALLDLFSFVNEELAGVMSVGIVLAILVNGGFVQQCNPAATSQPKDAQFIVPTSPSNPSGTSTGTGGVLV